MEIKYSINPIDEDLFGKNLIVGLHDPDGDFLKQTIPNLRTIKNYNTKVKYLLKLKVNSKRKQVLNELLDDLDISKDILKRNINTLSTSELIKVQTIEAFLSNSKIVVLKGIDRLLNYRDAVNLLKALKNHTFNLKKTVVLETTNVDNIIAMTDRYIFIKDHTIIYQGRDYKHIPYNTTIKDFVDLANEKGARLNSYKDESDLLKAIFRSVNRK